ncbi:hypothetical protein AB0I94_15675 [Streptomyces sp. NPDC050147]|uniref:hypothetical protein n=1 Tax=Streptomyces sp. NPDC050147 TaxID=3155513 RepID=UPI0034154881
MTDITEVSWSVRVLRLTRAHPRRALVGERLAATQPDGTSDERDVCAEELGDVLDRGFGIELNTDDRAEVNRAHCAGA